MTGGGVAAGAMDGGGEAGAGAGAGAAVGVPAAEVQSKAEEADGVAVVPAAAPEGGAAEGATGGDAMPSAPTPGEAAAAGGGGEADAAAAIAAAAAAEAAVGGASAEWEGFAKFGEVHSLLEANRLLIKEITANQDSQEKDALKHNETLIATLNKNLAKVVDIYNSVSVSLDESAGDAPDAPKAVAA